MLKDGFNILARTNGYKREGGECHKSLWQAGIMAFLKIVAKLEKIREKTFLVGFVGSK